MKDRIAHIMRAKNLKASDFASLLGIQPSGISHILSGRNQPSLDFVKKIKETFPEYNLDWIIFGTGPITTSDTSLFKPSEPTLDFSPDVTSPDAPEIVSDETAPPLETPAPALPSAQHSIKSIVVFYADGTFESYSPQ